MTVNYFGGCPSCGATHVRTHDSRPTMLGGLASVRRRRRCAACGHRWTTYELPEEVYQAMLRERELMEQIATIYEALRKSRNRTGAHHDRDRPRAAAPRRGHQQRHATAATGEGER